MAASRPPPADPRPNDFPEAAFAIYVLPLHVKKLPVEQRIPTMTPAPGERLVRFVGDRIRFTLRDSQPAAAGNAPNRWRGLLRTNLGRGAALRHEIIAAHAGGPVHAGASWRDVPMQSRGDVWEIELPLVEAGFFKAKPYLLDPKGWQHWPDGPDVGISIHPNFCRTANAIYCAFTRLFGPRAPPWSPWTHN